MTALRFTTASPSDDLSCQPCGEGQGLFFRFAAVMLLFLLIMGLAGSVDTETLKAQFHRRLAIICGLGCQFVLMPLIGFVIIGLVQPEEHVALVLMILVSSSGGAYSNWWCSLFNADLALSVAMTAVSTLFSAVMLPLNLTFYLKILNLNASEAPIDVPWIALFQGVGTVILAIFSGVVVSTRYPCAQKRMMIVGNVSGVCMILLTLSAALFPQRPCDFDQEEITPLWGKPTDFYVVVGAPFFASLATSLAVSSLRCLGLSRPERVTITIEVSYQNVGIASAVALTAFCANPRKRSDAAAVPLVYGLIEASSLALFCLIAWKAGWTYARKEQAICEVLKKDMQPKFRAVSDASRVPGPSDLPSDGKVLPSMVPVSLEDVESEVQVDTGLEKEHEKGCVEVPDDKSVHMVVMREVSEVTI